jgi:lysophospholipase L1-like esterase
MKILFQGDSITDAGRDRNDIHNLGNGYPKFAAEYIKEDYPEIDFEFVKLSISGKQTKDLVARLESDFVDIQPDIVSIMIGINDVWHHAGDRSWIPAETFENNYRTILTALKERTNAKIVMIEPFLLPTVSGTDNKDFFREDLDPKIQIIRKLAYEFADVYIPTDGLFASGLIGCEPMAYSADGVHPNTEGAIFIGEYYADAVAELIEELK